MIGALLIAVALAGAEPVSEAARALAAGRIDQAGTMIAAARQQGAGGEALQRLTADHALVSGATARALDLYRALIAGHPDDLLLLERGAQAALRLDFDSEAVRWLDRATRFPRAGWRVWNLRGAVADRMGQFDQADAAYAHAAALAPRQAAIANNRGWSLMLRGRWSEAATEFATALVLDPQVAHGAANLELANTALAADLPEQQAGEPGDAFAARLNDAGVVADASGDHPRAVAAFTRAIEARSQWFDRAARNLAANEAGAR